MSDPGMDSELGAGLGLGLGLGLVRPGVGVDNHPDEHVDQDKLPHDHLRLGS